MKMICSLCALLIAIMVGTSQGSAPLFEAISNEGAQSAQADAQAPGADDGQACLPATLLASYYAGQNDSAFDYFQHKSIQKFLAMWVKEETQDIENPTWNLGSFTRIRVLDHDLVESHPEESLYCCTFSNGKDRFGYIIMQYNEADPSMGNWGVTETTPHLYDFKTNIQHISADLQKTDIDLKTATASRVYLIDKENKRADQVIYFTDGKGDRYFGYFGHSTFEIEKW